MIELTCVLGPQGFLTVLDPDALNSPGCGRRSSKPRMRQAELKEYTVECFGRRENCRFVKRKDPAARGAISQ
jgi:hypothetical protein